VEQVVHKFTTFEEAEEADRAYYRALTPAERLSIMIDMIYPEGGDAASARFERVYRIVKFEDLEN
jgi:hypothetical protein